MRRAPCLWLFAVPLFAVLVVPLPTVHSALWAALENAAHAPVFGGIALLVVYLLRDRDRSRVTRRTRYLLAFLAGTTLGVAIEVVQFFGPRDASWDDLVTNALGAAAAVTAHAAFTSEASRGTRAGLWLVATVCVVAVLAPIAHVAAATIERNRQFPVLVDFDSWLDTLMIRARRARIERIRWPALYAAPRDSGALRIDFEGADGSGVVFEYPAPDWSGYNELLVDIANPESRPMKLIVRVDDALHDKRREDRYEEVFEVPAETRREIRIPLADIRDAPRGRETDLSRITAIFLYRASDDSAHSCYLGTIRLQ